MLKKNFTPIYFIDTLACVTGRNEYSDRIELIWFDTSKFGKKHLKKSVF